MKKINLGLIGFGTIGSGVVKLLQQSGDLIEKRLGAKLVLKKIADLDVTTPRVVSVKKSLLTADAREILTDPDIHIVIELMGGYEPARTFLLEAMRRKKHVVTANKALLATHGNEIFKVAEKEGVDIGFEASVGGTIPVIKTLKESLVANRIKSIFGILNGTSNYILSKMTDEGKAFDVVLKEAQALGFAEADPTFDIEGYDAGHKIAILSMIAFNKKIDYTAISIEGITRIGALDIEYAREMGYRIKLLGIGKRAGDRVDIRVHPTMLPLRHPLASVQNEFNAVMITGDMTGPVTLTGKGAGSHPTASAVVSDIVRIAQRPASSAGAIRFDGDASYVPPGERLSRYYMRVHTEDSPGILAKIAGVLAAYGISIASVIQKESDMPHVPLVIMTHEAHEEGLFTAVKKINAFDFVEGDATVIRVEDYVSDGADHE